MLKNVDALLGFGHLKAKEICEVLEVLDFEGGEKELLD